MIVLDELDKKALEHFRGFVVKKDLVGIIPPVPLATVIKPAFLSCVRIFRMITGFVFILPARKSLVIL